MAVAVLGVGAGAIGAAAGGAIGTAISPGIGTAIGAGVGAAIFGIGAAFGGNALMAKLFETDGEQMYEIISAEFSTLAEDYLINEDEASEIADKLKTALSGDTLKDMYASEDREAFALSILEPLFEEQAAKREKIAEIDTFSARYSYRELLTGIVFVH